ncbi:hypothetical protein Dred_3141 [Desulforamulus reducens MI-1]|uniref:Outer membrane efflux protein n=1 Tax=Desulforamulus reducens (strain ATCC BAA-1160 / DSM 100696 / MI-1) TaxID=349161 RepID=A4J990_DESRM|nr:TolC family protein [Desulforamulus reducens]ABO51643.1 hypothetical protein Dred_3141 [Desulforamulus reducens MI-1]
MRKKIFILMVSMISIMLQAMPSYAQQTVDKLTLQQATQKAFIYNTQIKNTELDMEKLDITRDNIKWSMNGIMSGYNIPEQQDREIHKVYFETDLGYRSTEKLLDNQKRQLVIDVKEAYYNVLLAKKDLATAHQKLAVSLIKHSQVVSKYEVGMATQMDVLTAESTLKEDKAAIEEKTNTLTKAYSNLNKLMGNNQEARPELVDTVAFTPIENLDVDTMVLRSVNNSFEVWAKKEKAKKESNAKYYEDSYDIGEYTESQAQNEVRDTEESIRLLAKAYCLDILDKQTKYMQYEVKEKQLQETLKVVKAKYEVGMATKDVVDEVAYSLGQLQVAKLSTAVSHTVTVDKLQKLTGELNPVIK